MGDHFYTTSTAERGDAINVYGYRWEGVTSYVLSGPRAGSTPLYRLWSGWLSDHFYTTSAEERDSAIANLGFGDEGVAGHVYADQVAGTIPLYRLFSSADSNHFYTTDEAEAQEAAKNGYYAHEGIACYVFPSAQAGVTPLYRLREDGHSIGTASEFDIERIDYDLEAATVAGPRDQLLGQNASNTVRNGSSVQQTNEIAGLDSTEESTMWSTQIGLKLGVKTKVSGGIGIPGVADAKGEVEVATELSTQFTYNESKKSTRTWSWKQPLVVPPRTSLKAKVLVRKSDVTVPYVTVGTMTWADGFRARTLIPGVFRGTNSHDLEVTIFDLTPTAAPDGNDKVPAQAPKPGLAPAAAR